jgi:Flp pilus assembly protein TadD
VAKATLVRWRLHSLLASAADDIAHYRIACELRGELWTSHAALGRALVRAGRAEEGVHHLRRAADLNPFDETLLPDLISALRACRDVAGERRAIEQVQLLRRAAPTTSCDDIRGAQEVVA